MHNKLIVRWWMLNQPHYSNSQLQYFSRTKAPPFPQKCVIYFGLKPLISWQAIHLCMNWTVKGQWAFFRNLWSANKHFLFLTFDYKFLTWFFGSQKLVNATLLLCMLLANWLDDWLTDRFTERLVNSLLIILCFTSGFQSPFWNS